MYITDKTSQILCNKLIKHEIISKETSAYYQYAFDFVLDLIIFNASLILLGTLLGAPFLSILYILTLTPLKMLVGGAHAWNRISCSVISYSVFTSTILLIQHNIILLEPVSAIYLYLISTALIILFTPVDCKNKRIPQSQRILYKKRCLIICCLLSCAFTYFVIYDCLPSISLMVLCVIIVLVNQMIGITVNQFQNRKNEK